MDPHYHIVPVQDTSYDTVAPPGYEYSTPSTYSREESYTHAGSQGPAYDGSGLLSSQPASSYPSYPASAQAMEYVQSMYQMQIAQEMAAGFSENNPYGARTIMTTDGRRKRRRIITHEQRKAANIRERRRMFHLNEAFDQLRKRVPTFAYEKKLSRIETLKLAVTYIKFMGDLVTELGGETSSLDLSGSSSTTQEGRGEVQDSPQGDGDSDPRVKQEVSGMDGVTSEEEEED